MDITFENIYGESTTKCGCSQLPLDCSDENGCPINLNLLCTFYDGETLPELKIYKGMTGQEVLVAINTYLLDIINNLDIKPTVLKSVGEGHVIYKGLSPQLFHEIKSLITDESLVVEEFEDELKLSLNDSYIQNLVNTLISENSTITMEYKYSSTLLDPGAPGTYGTWTDTYSQEAEWMAFREVLNSIPSPWKVIKIKGNPGRDGRDGIDGRDGRDGIDAIGINGISSITSIVFKRSTTKPAKPTGGTYNSPVPSGWSDGIPAENGNPVWMSKSLIYDNSANPQTPVWSEPSLIADTATLDFEWTDYDGVDPGTPSAPLNGAIWSNNPTTSSTWMAMAEILNGVKQPWKIIKIKGEEGNTSLTVSVFKRSSTKPATPTGGTFSNPFPSGWNDGIPVEDGNPAWISTRIFSSNGAYPQQDYWSEPTKIVDTNVVDYEFSNYSGESPGTPDVPLNGATWHNDATVDDIWMAISQISNGVRGPWTVAKIKGEGSPGQGIYKSIVYKRSSDNSPITVAPTGGSFLQPVPLDWSDGIPTGVGAVYQSSRIFTSDGQYPQEEEWGVPIIAVDNEFKDYAYSSLVNKPSAPLNTQGPIQDDATWHNNPTENDIWQAVRDVKNDVYGEWTIQKIKGEDGADGSQGITGSTGPSPRTFEWVVGTQYQYGDGYIDYIYYRGSGESDPCRGWYIVKPNPSLSKTTATANSGGCPNTTLFEKQPFTNNMSFSTVIAEQANLAGFIFKNQVLTSQASGYQTCGSTQTGPYPNLTIDGIYGVIKFLERLFLDKDGIVMKDDCGNPRIKFGLDNTKVPILQFLNEDGTIKWEAGKNGYQIIVTGTQPSTWNSFNVTKLTSMSAYNETSDIEVIDPDLGTYVLNNTVRANIQSELDTRYQLLQFSCSGSTSLSTPYNLVWETNAFNTLVHEYEKGDMAADANNYTGIYLNQTPILEADINTAPAGTFPEDGWYLIEGLSGLNRNSEVICSATQGVYPLMEQMSNTNQFTVNGYTLVTIGYIKKGKIIRNVSIAEKAQWERDSEGLTP